MAMPANTRVTRRSLRSSSAMFVTLLLVATNLIVLSTASPADAATPLATRYSGTIVGDVQMTGNAVLTCPVTDSVCIQALSDGSANGNARNMQYVDIDGNSSTFNSSAADVALPAGSSVVWAGLYWAGTLESANPAPNPGARNQVLVRTPTSAGYVNVSGAELGSSTLDDDSYGAFADVTSLVSGAGSGTYTVGNVQVSSGAGSTGAWGAWAIVVVYSDPDGSLRYVNVWDGYDEAFFAPLTFPISGYVTPSSGTVQADIGVFAGDGEPDVSPDSLLLGSTPLAAAPLNGSNTFFNSTISRDGANITARNPNPTYTLVADIDTVNADGVLAPGSSATTVTIDSSEGIWPVALWTSIEVAQTLAVTKASSADGGPVYPGDTITYSIDVENTSSVTIEDIYVDDVLPAGVTYVPGTAQIAYDTMLAGSFSRSVGSGSFDTGGLTQSYTVTTADIPAGSVLTSYAFTTTGSSIDWLSDISLRTTYPGGTAYTLGVGSFGGNGPGTFSQSRGPGTFGGSALGSYAFQWLDGFDGAASNDNTVTSARFTIGYEYPSSTVEPANPPPSLLTAGDNVDLAPGASLTITFDVIVDDPLTVASSSLVNTVQAAGAGIQPVTSSTSDTVLNPPNLSVTKSHSPDPAIIGEPLTYTVVVENNGGPADNVVVSDVLSDAVAFVSASFVTGSGTCAEVAGDVTCAVGSLAAGGSFAVEIEVVPTDISGGQLVPLFDSPVQVSGDSSTFGVAYRTGDWAGNDAIAGPLTVSATFSDLTGPASATSIPTGATGIVDAYADPYSLGSAALQPSFDFVFNWDASPEGGLTNAGDDGGTAVLTFAFSEPVTDPVLHIDRLGGFGTVNNSGSVSSARLTLLDGLTLTELSGVDHFVTTPTTISRAIGVPITGSPAIECSESTFLGSACGTIQINGTVSEVRFLMDAAPNSIEGSGGDGLEIIWDLEPVSALSVEKTASDIVGFPGDTFTYTITATNDGPNTEYAAVVNDVVPAGLTVLSSTATAGSYDGSVWNIGTMAADTSEILEIEVRIDTDAEAMMENEATVSGANSDRSLADNTAVAPSYTCPADTISNLAAVGSGVDEVAISDNADQTCTAMGASIVVSKISVGGTDTFDFSATNVSEPVESLTTEFDGVKVSTRRYPVVDLGVDVTISEQLPTDWFVNGVECVDVNSSLTGTLGPVASSSTTDVTIPSSVLVPGAEIECTFANDAPANLTIVKQGVGGGAGFDFEVLDAGGGILDAFELNPNPPSTPTVAYEVTDPPLNEPLTIAELAGNNDTFVLVDVSCVNEPAGGSGQHVFDFHDWRWRRQRHGDCRTCTRGRRYLYVHERQGPRGCRDQAHRGR